MAGIDGASDDIDEHGFKRIEGDYIFVAGSSDVHEERVEAERAIEDALGRLGKKGEVRVFSWDLEAGPEGLDQRRTMQRSIPRPSAPGCLGVVLVLGERIGLPLDRGFDVSVIGDAARWADHERFPLEPDWPDDPEEARRLLDGGAFPLTGGVFEFLDARGHRCDRHPEGKPVWMGVLAAEPVRLDGDDVELNASRWLHAQTRGLSPRDRRRWEDAAYLPQFQGVHNFLRACAAHGVDQNPTPDHRRLREGIEAFVRKRIFGARGAVANPYRELMHYDVHDAAQFHGREAAIGHAVERLEERFDAPDAAAAVRVTGPSGVGKSSFLRAGVLSALGDARRRGRYRTVALRPEDFKDRVGADRDVVEVLVEEVEHQGALALPVHDRRAVAIAGAEAPIEAARVVCKALAAQPERGARLVLALDQFEEIVDALRGPKAEHWQPLLRFVEAATAGGEVGLVYTLESSRRDAHGRLPLPAPFGQAREIDLAASGEFLESVIRSPFAESGYPLADDVVQELLGNLERLRDRDVQAARHSVLPLLALGLHHLWEFVALRFPQAERSDASSVFADRDRGIKLADLKALGAPLGLEKVIEVQARKAWHRAGIGAMDDDALDYLLQPFVGVQGDEIQLGAAPRDAPYGDERALIHSFRRHRLMVDAGDGLVRLVHEAILRHWPEASGWLERRRDYLATEARMRVAASLWEARGHPPIAARGKAGQELIADAVEVLGTYLRAWSFDERDVAAGDRALRDYCLAVFCKSTTPRAPTVREPEPRGGHAVLAATYGLLDLLERFGRKDPESLSAFVRKKEGSTNPLHSAAWSQGHVVRFLLEKGADPTMRDAQGWPPVSAPIQRRRQDIFVELMEAARAKVGVAALERKLACPNGRTLMHLAAQFNNLEALRDLLDRYGFAPDRPDETGWLPIHHACALGAADALELLRSRSDVGASLESGLTCLHLAAAYGQTAILDRLMKLPGGARLRAARTRADESALHHAALNHHAGCARSLLRNGLDPNEEAGVRGWRPLHLLLGGPKASSDAVDEEALIAALRAFLADPRTDPNATGPNGETPLALAKKHPAAQRILLDDERTELARPVAPGDSTGFFLALRLGAWGAVRRHVEAHGLPGDDADHEGNTVLHLLTAPHAPPDLLDERIAGASPERLNAVNGKGETPLSRALAAKNWSLAARMLEADGIGLHAGPNWFSWEVFQALRHDAPDELLGRLARVAPGAAERADGHGWTLLHHLCAHDRDEQVAKLARHMDLSAAWALPDAAGRRPVDLAGEALRRRAPQSLIARPWPEGGDWDAGVRWRPVPAREAKAFARRAEVDPGASPHDAARGELPFYPDASIVRLRPKTNGAARPTRYWIETEDGLHRLNGTSPPIHEVNAKLPLRLGAPDVLGYLKFFCFFVRGDEGPFFILDHFEPSILSEGTTEADLDKIRGCAHPAWVVGEGENGFDVAAPVFYSNAIFDAHFHVQRSGMIEMKEDFPAVTELSGRVRRPVAADRP